MQESAEPSILVTVKPCHTDLYPRKHAAPSIMSLIASLTAFAHHNQDFDDSIHSALFFFSVCLCSFLSHDIRRGRFCFTILKSSKKIVPLVIKSCSLSSSFSPAAAMLLIPVEFRKISFTEVPVPESTPKTLSCLINPIPHSPTQALAVTLITENFRQDFKKFCHR